MADVGDRGGKVQIVFLVDVLSKQHFTKSQELIEICKLRCRAISLCVLRLLLHFNTSVTYSHRTEPLSWGFKFFNSGLLNFEYKRRKFYDLDSHSFGKFEEEMKERFANASLLDETESKQTSHGAKILSCSLTEILHDFLWTTPDISSPSRKGKGELKDELERSRNYLFVVGDCPQDNGDIERFLGRKESCYTENVLIQEIFSSALYEEYRNTCDLSLFWIDTGLWCLAPEKLETVVKDWSGHKLMMEVTKLLGGNMIPISSLVNPPTTVHNGQNPELDEESCDDSYTFFNQSQLDMNKAMFHLSFYGIIQAFLSGKDLTGLSVITARSSLPKSMTLFYGFLYFHGHQKVCYLSLTPVLTGKHQTHADMSNRYPTRREEYSVAEKTKHTLIDVNFSKDCLSTRSTETQNPETSKDLATQEQQGSRASFSLKIGQKSTREVSKKPASESEGWEWENAFFIKGVISHTDVLPSWLHPTKLYSCLTYETSSDSATLFQSGMFQQLLLLISSKGLNMVVEFHDPESCAPVIGLLQPMTSVCAILSVVKTEMLVMIEKLLLRHRSHGHTLVPRDVTSNVTSPWALPVDLHENVPLSSAEVHRRIVSERASRKSQDSSNPKQRPKEKAIDLFIRNVDRKRPSNKDGKELFLKLRDYYSEKQSRQALKGSEETTVHQPLTRGKLCQDTAQKNNAIAHKETEVESNSVLNQPEQSEDPKVNAFNTNLDSEQTDAMESDENLPIMTDIETVDELKANLEEGYEKCINLDYSAAVFVTSAFIMIDRLKCSGQLKDLEHIMDVLKSSVLRNKESLLERLEALGESTNKDKIAQEYKLQVFLRLELASKIEGVDEESLADEITVMLRAISFQRDPTYLNSFLKNSILTRYADSLSSLLCNVYDGLMQRPPKEILSPSQISSEEDTPLKSCKIPSVSSKSESVEETKNSRTLVRRHSVMDVTVKRREIAVPGKAKSTKNRENEKRPTRSADKLNTRKASTTRKPVTHVKEVRRNLFMGETDGDGRRTSPRKQHKINTAGPDTDKLTRRHTIAGVSRSKMVLDTPVCKQVSKRMLHRQECARRRSKTVIDVTVVGESPLKEEEEEVVRPFPRRRAATFYSSSTSSSQAPKSSTVASSKAVEQTDDDTTISEPQPEETTNEVAAPNKSSRSLLRASSMTGNLAADVKPSSRRRVRRSLSLKESSSAFFAVREPFDEVFTETGVTTILPTKSSVDPSESSHDPSASSHDPSASSHDPSASSHDPSKSSHDPSKSSHVPSKSSNDPSKSSHDPSKSSHVPSKSSHDPSKSSHVPSKSSHVPSKSSHDPSKSSHDPAKSSHDPSMSSHDHPSTSSHDSLESSHDPSKSPTDPTRSSLPPTSTSKPTSRHSTRAITRRSNSSPSLSTCSPLAPYPSPSQARCSLISPKSFPSTSPILFNSPSTTPKLSPVTENIFDIAIPLTPFKSIHVKSVNSVSKSPRFSPKLCPTPLEKHSDTTESQNTGTGTGDNSPSPSRTVRVNQNKTMNNDSESVVAASPQVGRKRSLISSFRPSAYEKDLSSQSTEVCKKRNFVDGSTAVVATMNEKDGASPTMNSSTSQNYDLGILKQNSHSSTSGLREQPEVFTSPVARKRKRLTLRREGRSGSVSPLNQILKQRKKHQNAPPGTSPKQHLNFPDIRHSSLINDDSNSKRNPFRKIMESEEVRGEDQGSYEEPDVTHKLSLTNGPVDRVESNLDYASSPDDASSSPERRERYLSSSVSPTYSVLQPHFTPTALSASSLKHLEESPVLLDSGSQSSDCFAQPCSSLTRKWSERGTPVDASRLTLHKRLRHDS